MRCLDAHSQSCECLRANLGQVLVSIYVLCLLPLFVSYVERDDQTGCGNKSVGEPENLGRVLSKIKAPLKMLKR